MKTILVDSDVIVEVLRQRDSSISERWESLIQDGDRIACSPVTLAELWHGARPNEFAALTLFFEGIECLPVDGATGRLAGDYLRQFTKSHRIELGDALIAATASIHGLPLWTRNRKHFPMKDIGLF